MAKADSKSRPETDGISLRKKKNMHCNFFLAFLPLLLQNHPRSLREKKGQDIVTALNQERWHAWSLWFLILCSTMYFREHAVVMQQLLNFYVDLEWYCFTRTLTSYLITSAKKKKKTEHGGHLKRCQKYCLWHHKRCPNKKYKYCLWFAIYEYNFLKNSFYDVINMDSFSAKKMTSLNVIISNHSQIIAPEERFDMDINFYETTFISKILSWIRFDPCGGLFLSTIAETTQNSLTSKHVREFSQCIQLLTRFGWNILPRNGNSDC